MAIEVVTLGKLSSPQINHDHGGAELRGLYSGFSFTSVARAFAIALDEENVYCPPDRNRRSARKTRNPGRWLADGPLWSAA